MEDWEVSELVSKVFETYRLSKGIDTKKYNSEQYAYYYNDFLDKLKIYTDRMLYPEAYPNMITVGDFISRVEDYNGYIEEDDTVLRISMVYEGKELPIQLEHLRNSYEDQYYCELFVRKEVDSSKGAGSLVVFDRCLTTPTEYDRTYDIGLTIENARILVSKLDEHDQKLVRERTNLYEIEDLPF